MKKKKCGRPKKYTAPMPIRICESALEKLRAESAITGLSIAQLIRKKIEEAYENEIQKG